MYCRYFIDVANITGQMHIRGLVQYGGLNDTYLTNCHIFLVSRRIMWLTNMEWV